MEGLYLIGLPVCLLTGGGTCGDAVGRSVARRFRGEDDDTLAGGLSRRPEYTVVNLPYTRNRTSVDRHRRGNKGMLLTYPSGSLSHLVCPMAEDAFPQNPLYSALSPNEQQPPLSSVTPSCGDNGRSSYKRSGCLRGARGQAPTEQDLSETEAAKSPPRLNMAPDTMEQDSDMVQVSHTLSLSLMRAGSPQQPHATQGKYTLDYDASECLAKLNHQGNACGKGHIPTAQDVDERQAAEGISPDTHNSNMDKCVALTAVGENPPAVKGWVIGPLLQTFKSKMATFTDILMTPVKLFKTNDPPPSTGHRSEALPCDPHTAGPSVGDTSETSQTFEGNSCEPFPQGHIMQNKLRSLCFSPPDALGEACDITDGVKKDGGISIQTSPVSAFVVGEKSQKSTLEAEQAADRDVPSVSLATSAATAGKSKRRLKMSHPDVETDLVKRKKRRAETFSCVHRKTNYVISASALLRSSENTVTDLEVAANVPVLKAAKQVRKKAQKPSDILQEKVHKGRRANPSAALKVSSEDLMNGVSDKRQRVLKRKKDTSSSHKGIKNTNKISLGSYETSVDHINLETTLRANTTKECQEKKLSTAVESKVCKSQTTSKGKRGVPTFHVKMLQDDSVNHNKKALGINCKSRKRDASSSELGNAFVSASSAMLTLELTSTDTSALVHKEVDLTPRVQKPSKMPQKNFRQSAKSSDGFQETLQTKECCQQNVEISLPMQSEITEPIPSHSLNYLKCLVYVNKNKVRRVLGEARETSSVSGEMFTDDPEVPNALSTGREDKLAGFPASQQKQMRRRTKNEPRLDSKRRKCRKVVQSTEGRDQREEEVEDYKEEEKSEAMPRKETSRWVSSVRLLRSYSCPEIPSCVCNDAAPSPPPSASPPLRSPPHVRSRGDPPPLPASAPHSAPLVPHNAPRGLERRARRHTVCNGEAAAARNFAPLCLRKEVYPSPWRPAGGGDSAAATSHRLSPTGALHSPSSLSARALSFLSSPLAFLSKGAENNASPSRHLPSPSSPRGVFRPPTSARCLTTLRPRLDDSTLTSAPNCSQLSLACDLEHRRPREEEDWEDTGCSGTEFEDIVLSEEKALPVPETKVEINQKRRVSSIRIRKALPKPLNNLTPMGLPRPVRLKKKEFSLEEIYTNKNFTKPPESRLETIPEMPLSCKNGSQCLFGPKRVKRSVIFPDVGEPRKPRRPLVGAAKPGRTRRGGVSKDVPPRLGTQDVDRLLCTKLEQLDLWLISDH